MAELRVHDAGAYIEPELPELRVHDAGVFITPEPVVKEFRIHEAGVTLGVPPSGPGGVWVYTGGQWVKHRVWVYYDGAWR